MKTSLLHSITKNWLTAVLGAITVVALLASVGLSFLVNPQIAYAAPVTIFSDGFETPPPFSSPVWEQSDNKWTSNSASKRTGSRGAQVEGNTGSSNDVLKQEESTVGHENIALSYWFKVKSNLESNDNDRVRVQWYNGSTWTTLYTIDSSDNGDGWIQKTHNLPAGADGNANFAFRFVAKLDAGNDKVYLDDVNLIGDKTTGTIKITKLIDEDGNLETTDDQTPASGWDFYLGEASPYTTGENGMTEVIEVEPDEDYYVEESVKEGYELLSASCTGAEDNGERDGDRIEYIDIESGDEVECTFINALLGEDTSETIVVDTNNQNGWFFVDDNDNSLLPDDYVFGPGTAPLGDGSAHLAAPTTGDRDTLVRASSALALDDITTLTYKTYQTSTSGAPAIALQFNIDDDITDGDNSWKGRLVYEPYYTHSILTGVWQSWDTQDNSTSSGNGNWWFSNGTLASDTGCSISTPCTWNEVLSALPDGGIHPTLGAILFKVGGGWTGFDGNVDEFVFGVKSGADTHTTTYDFEPIEEESRQCTVTVYSDTTNTVTEKDDAFAVTLSFIHTGWTAIIDGATWIWGDNPVSNPSVDETQTFVKTFEWSGSIDSAVLDIASDNYYTVKLNGVEVSSEQGNENNFQLATQDSLDVSSDVVEGVNTLEIEVTNKKGNSNPKNNPAGLLYSLTIVSTEEGEGCMNSPEPETPWCSFAGEVVDYTADVDAKTNGGAPVNPARRNIAAVETIAPYQNIGGSEGNDWNVNPLDFFTLGIEGFLVYEFTDQVAFDQPGDDIAIYEITGGTSNTAEKVRVLVSQNGIDFVEVETISGDGAIDISGTGLDYVKFVKLIDDSVGIQGSNGDGYDVDAIVILQGSCGDEPAHQCENLLVNGSFEEPIVTNGSLWQKFASVTGWVIQNISNDSATTLEAHRGWSGNAAAEGEQYVELDGDHSTRITQTVTTIPGATYDLFWAFAPRHNIAAEQNQLSVSINGSEVASEGPATGLAGLSIGDWVQSSHTFVAGGSSTDVAFADAGPSNSYGTFLDDARLCLIQEPEAAPYCGDGIQNQKWEQCDGGEQCTQQCQTVTDQCTEDIFARVVVDNVSNTGNGDMTSDIYLGQGVNSIPQGTWFPVVLGGSPIIDPALSGYDDVPGFAVERGVNGVTALLFGSRSSRDVEHIDGHIEFFNSSALTQTSLPGQDKLEKEESGEGSKGGAGNDEVWLDSGLSHFWLTTTVADDGYTTSYADAPSCNPFGTVTMCKYDDQEQPLSGWTLTLLGDQLDSFSVPANTPSGADSVSLASTTSYVALASGVWLNDRNPDNHVDAEYSTENLWSTWVDGFPGHGVGILELEINETDGSWGPYNSLHEYAQAFVPASDGPANFRMFDGNTNTHTVNPSWYGDNKGSLDVVIHEGYAGITGRNGCVVFENVPFGEYVAGELEQEGWTQIDGPKNPVTVETELLELSLVNTQRIIEVPEEATLHATKIVCEAEEYLPNWGNGSTGPSGIDADTATDWLAEGSNSEYCELAPDWDFQWVTNSDSSSNPGDNLTTPVASPWATFGSTDSSGVATTTLPTGGKVWVREILKDGHVPFSGQNTTEHVSAELYCGNDVLNYDNWDFISSVADDETYYCVAFNALERDDAYLTIHKETNYGDGEFDFTISSGHNIVASSTLVTSGGLAWSDPIGLAVGTYSVLEIVPEGWYLEESYCEYDGESAGQAVTNGHEIYVEEGDEVSCYFYNEADHQCDENEHFDYKGGECVPNEGDPYSDLSVEKSVDDETPEVGQQITYTITLENDGPHAAGSIEALDILPDGVTYVSHIAGSGTYATTTGIWTVPSLGDEGLTTLEITVEINSGEEGQIIINVVEIDTFDGIDENSSNNADSAEVIVESNNPPSNPPNEPPTFGPLGGGITGLGGGGGGGGVVLGASISAPTQCTPLLTSYMRIGFPNDPSEVSVLQDFLNRHMSSGLTVNGFFGAPTEEAVKRFQWEYRFDVLQPWGISQPTGIVYLTTLRKINMIECSTIEQPLPPLVEWPQS